MVNANSSSWRSIKPWPSQQCPLLSSLQSECAVEVLWNCWNLSYSRWQFYHTRKCLTQVRINGDWSEHFPPKLRAWKEVLYKPQNLKRQIWIVMQNEVRAGLRGLAGTWIRSSTMFLSDYPLSTKWDVQCSLARSSSVWSCCLHVSTDHVWEDLQWMPSNEKG